MQSTSEGIMPSTMSINEIIDLANNLRQERLFVTSEQQTLQNLNEKVAKNSLQVYQAAWISAQQRINLNRLIVAKPDSSPATCCQRANSLESVKFVDAFKVLKYQDVLCYGNFLQCLRRNPELVARCLVVGDRMASEAMSHVTLSLSAGLYGICLVPEDTNLLLQLLRYLLEMQLLYNENPRRILRQGSCAFSGLYSVFHEGLFSAKLFLSAALNEPVLHLLMEDEVFLDIDPEKTVDGISQEERLRKFGREGTPDFQNKVQKHRKWTITALVTLTNKFITSLRNHWLLFPNSVAWLVRQMAAILTKNNFQEKEINALCTDLVFTHFICPAIVNPEPYGVIDAPVSPIAQFNLMQVAQIVQMLALIKYQDVDPKVKDVYSRFDKDCVTSLLDSLLVTSEDDDNILSMNIQTPSMKRTASLFTLPELQSFVSFFQLVAEQPTAQGNNAIGLEESFQIQLSRLLSALPSNIDLPRVHGRGDASGGEATSSPDTPKRSLLGKVSKPRISRMTSNVMGMNSAGDNTQDESNNSNSSNNVSISSLIINEENKMAQDVLIIPYTDSSTETIGLLPEHEVLSLELPSIVNIPSPVIDPIPLLQNAILPEVDISQAPPRDPLVEVTSVLPGGAGIEKRTRFSLSHDEGSIGNTSDNLEAVSEAASNHSVASSLELENEDQNDNLSDMVSANVSGRGTPNISGRDTPSSQVTEGGGAPEARAPPATPNAKTLKQTRSDIQDKFCKFEIKKLLEGDETISIISDTWSTDVLASDSETIEAYERNFTTPVLGNQQVGPPISIAPTQVLTEENNRIMIGPQLPERIDVSETQSESAWSTDVLASDSERMTEIDTDDCHSVARSDTDTARSEADIEARTEPPLPDLPPLGPLQRFPSPLSPLVNMSPIYPRPPVRLDGSGSLFIGNGGEPLNRDVLQGLNHDVSSTISHNTSGALPNCTMNSPSVLSPLLVNNLSRGPNSPSIRDSFQLHNGVYDDRFNTRSLSLFESHNRLSFESTHSTNSLLNNSSRGLLNTLDSSSSTSSVFHSISSPFVNAVSTTLQNSRVNGIHPQGLLSRDDSVDNQLVETSPLNLRAQSFDGQLSTTRNNKSDIPDSSRLINKINLTTVFKPIKDEKSIFNVTGRGGRLSDYRRRTMEYVDSNANSLSIAPNSPGSNGDTLDVNPLDDYNVQNVEHLRNNTNNGHVVNNHFINGEFESNVQLQNENLTDLVTQMRSASISEVFTNNVPKPNIFQRQSISLSILDDKTLDNPGEIQVNNIKLSKPDNTSTSDSISNVAGCSSQTSPPKNNNSKPSISTGAIPKSISFDSTAEKSHREYEDHRSIKRGMNNVFNKLKLGFKNRRGKGRGEEGRYDECDSMRSKRNVFEDKIPISNNQETGEDILAKYRRKASSSSEAATSAGSDSTASHCSSFKSKSTQSTQSDDRNESRLHLIPNNLEASYCYADAKRKLRLVLSTADLQCTDFRQSTNSLENPLVTFLRIQLSEAITLQDGTHSAQLTEALRSARTIGVPGSRRICKELQHEYQARSQYIQYLVQARQALLRTLAYLDRLQSRVLSDRFVCNSHLVWVCVRLFLERREHQIQSFCEDFRILGVSDEKTDLLQTFLNDIIKDLRKDQNWQAASPSQLQAASLAVERVVMGRVYLHALYPNGDGDISRDQVLSEHIRKLARVVTVNHKDLRIPIQYHREAPWPYAQLMIQSMAAYRAPRDKVQCVVRCVTTIMNLLSMAFDRAVPAADDLIPVLVYVLIRANPPSLLSTIQYVNSFHVNSLEGEVQYWWIQFCSAVEFIKTMDYSD